MNQKQMDEIGAKLGLVFSFTDKTMGPPGAEDLFKVMKMVDENTRTDPSPPSYFFDFEEEIFPKIQEEFLKINVWVSQSFSRIVEYHFPILQTYELTYKEFDPTNPKLAGAVILSSIDNQRIGLCAIMNDGVLIWIQRCEDHPDMGIDHEDDEWPDIIKRDMPWAKQTIKGMNDSIEEGYMCGIDPDDYIEVVHSIPREAAIAMLLCEDGLIVSFQGSNPNHLIDPKENKKVAGWYCPQLNQ